MKLMVETMDLSEKSSLDVRGITTLITAAGCRHVGGANPPQCILGYSKERGAQQRAWANHRTVVRQRMNTIISLIISFSPM